ncbi:MAG: argininosuccinate lyase [Lachnospiraceae bacterium]|nr:argininosuccinate lyase [Lachnospiraceae bacterium]
MAQLWGGRFTKETDQLVYNFNASIEFDKKFYRQDMEGSIAHVKMLGKQGILTEQESREIVTAIREILKEVEAGTLEISHEYEDIHSFVEAALIERLGDTGKKLHTGRSRNDQVALDMRLFTRQEVLETDELLNELLNVILTIMENNVDTYMPGFTHLQKAQPVTLAHHLGAYFEMFKRDRQRMEDIYRRMNYCPLGSGALAGTTYDLDRYDTARQMGFTGPTLNSMDGVSDRDYLIEFLSALSTIMMHLSRFSEEVIIWNSNEYQFVEIDDAYSTGSSIMPQKKNPDIAELVRGKTGRVYGTLISLLTTMKGIPLAYNKDMQEDKELTFDAMDTVKGCLALFTGMLSTMKFCREQMEASAKHGFTNATDAADYLVNHGVPFRDAHGIVGKLVLYCIEKQAAIDDLSLKELKEISPVFEEDIFEAVSMETCVKKRLTIGAPGQEAMKEVIALEREYLSHDWKQTLEDWETELLK